MCCSTRQVVLRRPGIRDQVAALFSELGVDACIRALADPRDTSTAANEALTNGADAVIAGGGDGTVSSVAGVLAGTTTPLGVLPLGTLNHFAKDAGIPLDLQAAVKVIAARHTRRVDVARVNDHIFINNASIGVYPTIVAYRERLRAQGHFKWTAFALATVAVLRRDDDVAIHLETDSREIIARTPFVLIGNNEYLVEGLKLGARTRLDAGRVYAYFAPPALTRDLPKLFAHAVFGFARREHAIESISATQLTVDTLLERTISLACDGELLTLRTPLRFRSWPGALTLLAPAS